MVMGRSFFDEAMQKVLSVLPPGGYVDILTLRHTARLSDRCFCLTAHLLHLVLWII